MPTPGGPPGERPAAPDDGDSTDTGRTVRASRPRRLETDADITRLLQEHYPLIDDPAARAAIVAQFTRRNELRASQRRLRMLQFAGAVGLAVLFITVMWLVFRSLRTRVFRGPHG